MHVYSQLNVTIQSWFTKSLGTKAAGGARALMPIYPSMAQDQADETVGLEVLI